MHTRFLFAVLLGVSSASQALTSSLTVYDEALSNGFTDQGWPSNPSPHDLASTAQANSPTHSIRYSPGNWNGLLFFSNSTSYELGNYQNLTFWVHGGSAGGQSLTLAIYDPAYNPLGTYDVATLTSGGAIAAGTWRKVTLDFDSAGLLSGAFSGVMIMDATGNPQPDVYIDDIVFASRTTPPPAGVAIAVTVDVGADVHPVSPDIFGVNFGDAARNAAVGYTIRRWGGNAVTRHNPAGPAHNAGSDYFFLGYGNDQTTSDVAFITEARNAGMGVLVTVPTIGWTQKFDPQNPTTVNWSFSQVKYGPQTLDECRLYGPNPPSWCHADAGNGVCDPAQNTKLDPHGQPYCQYYGIDGGTSQPVYHIVNNDPHDTSIEVGEAQQAAWIANLQTHFGTAANGGVKFYALDNEPILWNSTHRDVHPTPLGYDELWSRTLSYATAIKTQEPDAQITGPVTWGLCDLFGSASDNCVAGSDRTAHGGVPLLPWYIGQICANPLPGGKRPVDYIDIHYYPQGVDNYSPDTTTTAAPRLRSLKELYDPSWVSESWIADLGDDPVWHYSKPNLIPRVKAWINQYCPGLKLAITEYDWGPDDYSSAAIAQAEALAIFAREGVDMAMRWVAPAANSKVERGFRIFLNYDGSGAHVQGDSVRATSGNVDQVGAYAFRKPGQKVMVLLTNKDSLSHDVTLTFAQAYAGTWTLYGFSGSADIATIGSGTIAGTGLTLTGVPAMSVRLLVLPDTDTIYRNGFD